MSATQLGELKHFAPRASTAVGKLRGSHPGAEAGELEASVKHQTSELVAG